MQPIQQNQQPPEAQPAPPRRILPSVIGISLFTTVFILLVQIVLNLNTYSLRTWVVVIGIVALCVCILASLLHLAFSLYRTYSQNPHKKLIAVLAILGYIIFLVAFFIISRPIFAYWSEIVPKQTITTRGAQRYVEEERKNVPGKEDYILVYKYKNFLYYGPRINEEIYLQ